VLEILGGAAGAGSGTDAGDDVAVGGAVGGAGANTGAETPGAAGGVVAVLSDAALVRAVGPGFCKSQMPMPSAIARLMTPAMIPVFLLAGVDFTDGVVAGGVFANVLGADKGAAVLVVTGTSTVFGEVV
jgi:hypothetical protein